MRIRPWPPAVLLVLGLLLVAASCSTSGGTTTSGSGVSTGTGPSTTVPSGPSSIITAPPTTDPPGLRRFTLYWIRDCADPEHAVDIATCRIAVGETRLTDRPDLPQAALDALLLGPSDVEKFNGEQTNIRAGTRTSSLTIDNGVAQVGFNRLFETAKTRPQVAQVVFTLTQFPEIKKVQFLIDGQTNGATGVAAQDRNDLSDMTPSVLMESPTLNATVPSAFKMHGNAIAASGDTFAYRVLGPGDAELVAGKVKVLASPGTRGPFLEPVKLPPATTGPVTIVTAGPKGEVRTPITIG
jgi:hypothetical protein